MTNKYFSNSKIQANTLFTICFAFILFPLLAKGPALTTKQILNPPPRIIRTCCAFGSDLSYGGIPFFKRNDIISLKDIGTHHYLGGRTEDNGIIYTRRGGFIDMGHMRDCADWTAYLYSVIVYNQKNKEKTILNLGSEGGSKELIITIPSEIDSLSVYQLAGKIAFDLSLWHEIATWFGASSVPLLPERYSSFSPEDLYSNLLGATLAISAIKSDLPYDEAMTMVTSNMLDTLEAFPTAAETYAAFDKVKNLWWTNKKPLPSKNITLKRYFALDSYLFPWLIPEYKSALPPIKLTRPDANLSNYYQLKIKLNYKFPVKSLAFSSEGRTITQKDFDLLINRVIKDVGNIDQKMASRLQKTNERKDKRKENKLHFSNKYKLQLKGHKKS